ncbi:MAG TPA: ABC transporter permease [Candidatus Limnocylindrales bacterium]|nr:ABC transporter permease [Candidatus Limnocylindrales bacterium]
MPRTLKMTGFFILLLLVWEWVYRMHIYSPVLFPSPIEVGRYIVEGFKDHSLLEGIYITLRRLLLGYSISVAIGIPLGLLLAQSPLLQDTLGALTLGLQNLPSICWTPLAILWIGQNETAILFIVVMGALGSIIISTQAGVQSVSPIYVRAARTMGSRGLHTYLKVSIPASLPAIVTGMKMGWSFAWRSLMAGEMILFTIGVSGLGHILHMGRELLDMPRVIGVMLIIIAIGLITDKALFGRWEAHIHERWGTSKA